MHKIKSSQESQDVAAEVAAYVTDVLEKLFSPPVSSIEDIADEEALANQIFSILTSRKFCYLSRKRVECYRQEVIASIVRRIGVGEPLRLFYDIGPGYHATTRPGEVPLRFDVGLSELLILAQVNALCVKISEVYSPGARFWFVIDNLCALRTNDVPLECTQLYVREIRHLIESTGMTGKVDLVVESEAFDLTEYDEILDALPHGEVPAEPSPEAVDNVARFLGRTCTPGEAAVRMERYGRTGPVTDRLVDRLVKDVHMTQRATGATLGFRPFPGGDQRTQAGELVLTRGSKGRLRPLLLTSRNVDFYDCLSFRLEGVIPAPIPFVVFASSISS